MTQVDPDNPNDALRATLDPAYFSDKHFGWKPYPYQREVMEAVLVRGARRVAWVAGRRVGKTLTVANVALQLAIRQPGTQVAVFAPTFNQAAILLKRAKEFLVGSAFERNEVAYNASEMRLRFGCDARGKPRESVISAYSMTGKVRGRGADVLIVDESAFCKAEDYRSKAFPFVAERQNSVIIHISTRLTDEDNFAEVLRQYRDLPGALVFETPTRMNPTVTQDMLQEYRDTMLPSEFAREYECKLIPSSGVFTPEMLRACLRDYELRDLDSLEKLEPRRHRNYFVGVDWGKNQDRTVIAAVEVGTQEKANPARLVFLHIYEPDPRNPRHYTGILDDVLKVARHLRAQRVLADVAEGAHQAEMLRGALGAGRFRPFRFFEENRNLLMGNARMLVERRALELPLEPDEARRAFANVQETEAGYEHASRKSKDVFDAIALALLEAGGAAAPERPPMRALAVEPGGGGVGLYGREPPRLGDPRKWWLPREAWRYL